MNETVYYKKGKTLVRAEYSCFEVTQGRSKRAPSWNWSMNATLFSEDGSTEHKSKSHTFRPPQDTYESANYLFKNITIPMHVLPGFTQITKEDFIKHYQEIHNKAP